MFTPRIFDVEQMPRVVQFLNSKTIIMNHVITRDDREPNKYSHVCSCHFRDEDKRNMPTISNRNKDKLFDLLPGAEPKPPPKKKVQTKSDTVRSVLAEIKENSGPSDSTKEQDKSTDSRNTSLVEIELDMTPRELTKQKELSGYQREHYSVANLSTEVIRMETGIPTKEVFDIIVNYVARFKGDINYYSRWKVEAISLEDQVFITLLKLKQNYTNLHLAQLFSFSVATVSNIVLTFVHVLHSLLFKDIITTIPSQMKNKLCSPSSFSQYSTCRIIIDCTDLEIATRKLMSEQSATYSTYRGMNSFKVIIGVAPNAVITYLSGLFPGSLSDKSLVQESGLLEHFVPGDLILADKGFLIQDLLPRGVSVNIAPFLNCGKFTESEARATKSIARCRIHVERSKPD